MKVGDLVKDNHPSRSLSERFGLILKEDLHFSTGYNRKYRVLWLNGTIGNNVYDYDLKVISENR